MRTRLLPLIVLIGLFLFAPARAEAGLVLITRGDSVKHLGDVAPAHQAEVRQVTGKDGVKVGYVYRYFGIFWVDFWTWDGKYALYKDKTFWKLEPKEAAALMDVPVEKLGKPFTYSFPPGLIVLVLVALVIAFGSILSMRDNRRKKGLLADQRYVRAVEILRAAPAEGRAQAEKEAVELLVREGIPQPEAQANVTFLSSEFPATNPDEEQQAGVG